MPTENETIIEQTPAVPPAPAGTAAGTQEGGEDILASIEEKPKPEAPAQDEEFLKKLGAFDPEKLPEDSPLKKSFLRQADYTRKTQEVAAERQRAQELLNRAESSNAALLRIIEQRLGPQTPDARQEILDKIQGGDMQALEQFVDQKVSERIAPTQLEYAKRSAIERAGQLEPDLAKYEGHVAAALASNPELAQMAAADGFKNAAYIIAGLAKEAKANALASELKTLRASHEEDKKAFARRVLDEYKVKVQGLPTNTTRAGTPSGERSTTPTTDRDIRMKILEEIGMPHDGSF